MILGIASCGARIVHGALDALSRVTFSIRSFAGPCDSAGNLHVSQHNAARISENLMPRGPSEKIKAADGSAALTALRKLLRDPKGSGVDLLVTDRLARSAGPRAARPAWKPW